MWQALLVPVHELGPSPHQSLPINIPFHLDHTVRRLNIDNKELSSSETDISDRYSAVLTNIWWAWNELSSQIFTEEVSEDDYVPANIGPLVCFHAWNDKYQGQSEQTGERVEMENTTQFCYSVLLLCFWLIFLQDIKSKIRPKVKVNGLKTTETGGFSRLQVQSGVKAVKQHDGDDNSDVGRLSSGMQRLNDTAIKNRLRRQLDQLGVQLNLTMCSDILQKSVHTHSSVKNGIRNKRLNHNSSKLMKRLKKGS